MIKHFEEFRTDDDGTFYYYDDEKNENQWSYDLNELGKYIIKNEQEIERLQKDLTYYQKYSADLLNKNNTFESIINELEKWLEKQQDINDRTNSIIFNARGFEDKQVLNKLQELKDSDKE